MHASRLQISSNDANSLHKRRSGLCITLHICLYVVDVVRQHRFNTDLNSGRKNCWEPGLGSEEAGGKQSSDFWHKTG